MLSKCTISQHEKSHVQGASKTKLKKVNKSRTVAVKRVIIVFNKSRHPLLIYLHGCLRQYKPLKAVVGDSFADPCQEFKQSFLGGFLVVSPLFNHHQGWVI
jgi:hypothetical protein